MITNVFKSVYEKGALNRYVSRENGLLAAKVTDCALLVLAVLANVGCLTVCIYPGNLYFLIGSVVGSGVLLAELVGLYFLKKNNVSTEEYKTICDEDPRLSIKSPWHAEVDSDASEVCLPSKKEESECKRLGIDFPQVPEEIDSPKKVKVISSYLTSLQDERMKNILEKGFENLDYVTFDDLQASLATCCQRFNHLIGDEEYCIAVEKSKSLGWMAGLALPYLEKKPLSSCHFSWPNLTSDQNINCRTLLFVDDCSYTGDQLVEYITGHGFDEHFDRLYVVIPFVSTLGLRAVEKEILSPDILLPRWWNFSYDSLPSDVKLTLITSPHHTPVLEEIYSEEDLNYLRRSRSDDIWPLGKFYSDSEDVNDWFGIHHVTERQTLMYCQWKQPDYRSFPKGFARYVGSDGFRYNFLPLIQKPYGQRC